jgi:hypothetical protein
MDMQRRHRSIVMALAGVVLVGTQVIVQAATASPAAAATGLLFVEKTSPSDSQTFKSVAAQCPATKQVLGGGGKVTNGLGRVILDGMKPVATTPNAYWVGATEVDHERYGDYTENWSVTAYAICADRQPNVQIVRATASEPTPHGREREAVVRCPVGKKVVGTGAEVSPFGSTSIQWIRPDTSGDFVTVRAVADSFALPPDTMSSVVVDAYAVCAPLPLDGYEVVSTAGYPNRIFAQYEDTGCTGNRKVYAAGLTKFDKLGLAHIVDVHFHADLRGVRVLGQNPSTRYPNSPWAVAAWAICANATLAVTY